MDRPASVSAESLVLESRQRAPVVKIATKCCLGVLHLKGNRRDPSFLTKDFLYYILIANRTRCFSTNLLSGPITPTKHFTNNEGQTTGFGLEKGGVPLFSGFFSLLPRGIHTRNPIPRTDPGR